MKKLFLVAIIAAGSACVAYGQEQKPQDQKTTDQKVQKDNDQKSHQAKQAEWENLLKTELKLTDEQFAKFTALSKEFNEKKEAIVKDASLSDDARKEKKDALRKDKEAKLLEILTPEQQTRFKQLMEEMDKKKQQPQQKQ